MLSSPDKQAFKIVLCGMKRLSEVEGYYLCITIFPKALSFIVQSCLIYSGACYKEQVFYI